MSSVVILQYVAIISFVLAAFCAILCVVIFFRQDIKGVIGDLTGKTAAREVSYMRQESKRTENARKGKMISYGKTTSNLSKLDRTEKPYRMKTNHQAVSYNDATTLLQADNMETMVLLNETDKTTLLQYDEATSMLPDEENTALLDFERENCSAVKFRVNDTVRVVHTKEIII